jgi:pimeloyl-ACP methyl ester carboxylesterase
LILISILLWAHFHYGLLSPAQPQTKVPDHYYPDAKFINVDGFNICYVQRGSKHKPAVVLIHGLSGSIYNWRSILDPLAAHFHVTAFDLPGFGHSDKKPGMIYGLDAQSARILKLLDALSIQRCALVGHSMGGTLAAWLAKTQSHRLTKVALIAPAVGKRFFKLNPHYLTWALHLAKNRIVSPNMVRTIYKRVTAHNPNLNVEEAVEHYYRPYHLNPLAIETTYAHAEILSDKRLVHDLVGIQLPLLILAGAKDPVAKLTVIKRFAQKQIQAQLLVENTSAHLLAEESPTFVSRELIRFFDS